MRFLMGILSFVAAAVLAWHVVSVSRLVVLPYLRELGQERLVFRKMHVGPFLLSEPQLCIFEAVLALLVIGFIVLGIYAFRSRHTAD
jgi:hypothetical protein